MRAGYTRLFTDDSGVSHFEDKEVTLLPGFAAPPAEPLNVAQFVSGEQCMWIGGTPEWKGDVMHPSPRRQLLVIVKGDTEVTAGDGMVRSFTAGSVLLMEDTWGTGHSARPTGTGDCLGLVFTLPASTE
jgi:hypothetical protein